MSTLFEKIKKSPAMIVAIIAVVFAMSGTAVAARGLITGKDIKDGSITTKDLSKSTTNHLKGKTGKRGKVGAQGEAGPQGATGATGATGLTGAQGPKGDTGEKGVDGTNGQDGVVRLYVDGRFFSGQGTDVPVQSNFADYTGGTRMRSITLTQRGWYSVEANLSIIGPTYSNTPAGNNPASRTRCNLVNQSATGDAKQVDTFFVDFWRSDSEVAAGFRKALRVGGNVEVTDTPVILTVNCYAFQKVALTTGANPGGQVKSAKLQALPVTEVVDASTHYAG